MYDVFSQQLAWEQNRDLMNAQDGIGRSVMGAYNPAFSPLSKYERQMPGGSLGTREGGLLGLLLAQRLGSL